MNFFEWKKNLNISFFLKWQKEIMNILYLLCDPLLRDAIYFEPKNPHVLFNSSCSTIEIDEVQNIINQRIKSPSHFRLPVHEKFRPKIKRLL